MKRIYISSITIQGFRGINNALNPLVIRFNERGVTSIFAENGKGKSSIFEALYYCLNGCLPKFDNLHREIRDDKTKKNLFYLGKGKIDIELLDEKGSSITINFEVDDKGDLSIIKSTIPNPKSFLEKIQCNHNFLDYNTFIQILLKSPEETGKLFSDLVGFSEFPIIKEKIEKITRSQNINNDYFKTNKELLVRDNDLIIEERQTEVLKLLAELGFTETIYNKRKAISFLKKSINTEFRTIVKDLHTIKYDQLIKNRAGSLYDQNVAALNHAQSEKYQLDNLLLHLRTVNTSSLELLKKRLKRVFSKTEAVENIYIGNLLQNAIDVYEQTKWDKNTCILCKSSNLNKAEISFLDQLKNNFQKYKTLKDELNAIKEGLCMFIESSKFMEIESYFQDKSILPNENKTFTKIFYSKEPLSESFFDTNDFTKGIMKYKNELRNREKLIKREITTLSKKVPKDLPSLIEKSLKIKDGIAKISEISQKEIQTSEAKKYLSELAQWVNFINVVKEDYEVAFNDLMSNISSDINAYTKEFFISIMRNEEIIPLVKKDSKGQKINILLDKFYSVTGKGATPLLSESYRNALCLSIYFASALKNATVGNFIILDDITSSFDSGHQLYLLDLLKDKISCIRNKNGKQIIFLTHDGLLKKTLNGYSNGNDKWTHYALSGTKDELKISPFTIDDRRRILVDKINHGTDVGSDIRQYYEAVLLDIIEKLDLQIPFTLLFNPDKKIIENLLSAIDDIVQLRLNAAKTKIKSLPSRSDFKAYIQHVANNLSHYSTSTSTSVTPAFLKSLVDYIDVIQRRFQYECKCSRKLGWVYFKSLKGDKIDKSCTCII